MSTTGLLSLDTKPQSVRKFYFLDYFYVLLKSIQAFSEKDRVFQRFLDLKQQHQLGLSKYKTLVGEDAVSERTIQRYRYTFGQVLSEAEEYNLVKDYDTRLELTEDGKRALEIYEKQGPMELNEYLVQPMEQRYQAFRYLLEVCYNANPKRYGLLIFPVYSANRLGIERSSIRRAQDLVDYFHKLRVQLEKDVLRYLGESKSLDRENSELMDRLVEAGLLPRSPTQPFDQAKYNVILKRVRDYWLKYFLQDLYGYQFSLASFDIWAYRAKQIGIAHITEFYPDPGFSGRIVYPLSVVKESANPTKFKSLFLYRDKHRLFRYQPSWENENTREEFVQLLHHAYLHIRKSVRSRFVSLSNVRERVCYSMKISEYLFDDFLSRSYHERLKIRISMEVDRLPEETNAIYLKRTPVMVDGKYRNIIAIDLT